MAIVLWCGAACGDVVRCIYQTAMRRRQTSKIKDDLVAKWWLMIACDGLRWL
jgi:hypothetical protein